MRIAPAALAAFCHYMRLLIGNIGKDSAGAFLLDDSAEGHADDKILGIFTVAPAASAVFAALRGVFSLVTEIRKSREVGIRDKHNVAALSPIAAVGTACRDIFFTVKRHRAVAAVARFDAYISFIYKHTFTFF